MGKNPILYHRYTDGVHGNNVGVGQYVLGSSTYRVRFFREETNWQEFDRVAEIFRKIFPDAKGPYSSDNIPGTAYQAEIGDYLIGSKKLTKEEHSSIIKQLGKEGVLTINEGLSWESEGLLDKMILRTLDIK